MKMFSFCHAYIMDGTMKCTCEGFAILCNQTCLALGVGETGGHWDTGAIGTPPLIENP